MCKDRAESSAQEIEEKFPSLDVLCDQAQWAFERELERSYSIDTKSGAILASSSFLLAGMATLQVAIGNNHASWGVKVEAQNLAYVIAVVFLFVVALSLAAMWPRKFTIAPDPFQLSKEFSKKPEAETKQALLASRVPNYQDAERKVTCKSRLMWVSFIL